MPPSRDLIVNLIGRTGQLMGPMNQASAQMTQIGGTLTRTLTPAAAALGAGMALAGREFNSGVDALRVGTGATGEALSQMSDQMKSVSTNSSLARIGVGRVGEIMADVNTATGATGDTLEALTTQFGQLERMGVGADVNTVARAFGDWGIATEDQTAKLDDFFVAAQASGATVDELAGAVTQFGAPLRNLGFDLEESTALIASFQKNGVNLETVMGGLRQGIGKMAKAGEDVPETFRRVVDEIKNTEDASEATRLAIELFGQRAGPDLADSIRNGQFAVEDMEELIANSGETIDSAAQSTTRLSDKMAAFKNRIVGALGPFGEFGAVAGGALASIGPLMMGLGAMGPILGGVGSAFLKLSAVMMANPFVLIAAAVVALGVVMFIHREKILNALTEAWEKIKEVGERVWGAIKGFFEQWWPLILGIMTGGVGLVIALIVRNWDDIKAKTSAMIDSVVTFFRNLPGNILAALGSVISTLAQTGADLVQGLWTGAQLKYLELVTWVQGIPDNILGFLGDVGSILWDAGWGIMNGLWSGLKNRWEDVKGWFGSLGGRIKNLKGPLDKDKKLLIPEGTAIMAGLADGMEKAFAGHVRPLLTGATSEIGSTRVPQRTGGNVTVHVHPSPGMNERQLADAVAAAVRKGFL